MGTCEAAGLADRAPSERVGEGVEPVDTRDAGAEVTSTRGCGHGGGQRGVRAGRKRDERVMVVRGGGTRPGGHGVKGRQGGRGGDGARGRRNGRVVMVLGGGGMRGDGIRRRRDDG